MDNKLFFKESVLPVTLFCSALMFMFKLQKGGRKGSVQELKELRS